MAICGAKIDDRIYNNEQFKRELLAGQIKPVQSGFLRSNEFVEIDGKVMVPDRNDTLKESMLYKGLSELRKNNEEIYSYVKENSKIIDNEFENISKDKNGEYNIYYSDGEKVVNVNTGNELFDVKIRKGLFLKSEGSVKRHIMWEEPKTKDNISEYKFIKVGDVNKNKIITDPFFKSQLHEQSYSETKAQFDYDNTIDTLRSMMPNVKIMEVNDQNTLFPGAREYIHNGVVYFNKNRISPNTPFHLVQHVYSALVKLENPDLHKRMMKWAEEQISQNTPFAKYVLKDYSGNKGEDLYQEVIARFAEITDRSTFEFYTTEKKESVWNNIKDFITEWYATIKDFFRKQAGTYGHPLENLSNIYHLDLKTATIEDVITAMMKDAASGNFFTTISSRELARAYPKVMFDMSDQKITKATDFKYLVNFSGSERFTDEKFKAMNSMKEKVINYIIDGHTPKKDVVSINEARYKSWKKHFSVSVGRNITSQKAANVISNITGHSPKTMTIDNVAKANLIPVNKRMFEGTGDMIDDSFKPVVVVKHGRINQETKLREKAVVSLFHISNSPKVTAKGRDPMTNQLFNKYINSHEGRKVGFQFEDNEAGYYNFLLTLNAIELIQKNKTIFIDKIGTIGVSHDRVHQKLFSIEDGLKVIRFLSTKQEFMDKLDPYMQSLMKYSFEIKDKSFNDIISVAIQIAETTMNNSFYRSEFHTDLFQYMADYQKENNYENKIKLVNILNSRLRYLKQRVYGEDTKLMAQNEEVKSYTKLLMLLNNIIKGDINNYESIYKNWRNKWSSQPNIIHPVLNGINQTIKVETDLGIQRYEEEFEVDFMEHVRKIYKQWAGKGLERGYTWTMESIKEMGSEAFKHLFETVEVTVESKTGTEKKQKRIPMLHWDKNNEKTKQLIKEGKLTEADLEFTNYLLDKIRETLIEAEHSEKYWLSKEEITNEVDSYLIRGHIPTFSKSVNELFFSKNIKEGINKFWKKQKEYNEINEELTSVQDNWGKRSMATPFLHQLKDFDRHLEEVGLYRNEKGEYSLISKDGDWKFGDTMNESMSTNVELLGKTFVNNALHKSTWHRNIFPKIEATEIYLRMLENSSGITQQWVIDAMNQYANRMGFGMGIDKTQEKKIVPVMRMAMNLMATSFITTNPKVWLTITIGNIARTANFATTNYLTNQFYTLLEKDGHELEGTGMDIFGLPEMVIAQKYMFTQQKKVIAIDRMYKLIERDEDQLVTNARNLYTKKTFYNRNNTGWVMRHSDIFNRRLVMVAQMIKDGTWDAHEYKDGKITINETKDRRYYDKTGNLTEDGKILKDYYGKKLKEQQRVNKEGKWDKLYTIEDQQKFMWLSDRFVIGTYSFKDRYLMDDHSMVKILSQFKMYLVDVITNHYSKKVVLPYGKDVIYEETIIDPDGKEIKVPYATTEYYVLEGMFNSFGEYFKEVFKMQDGKSNFGSKLKHYVTAPIKEPYYVLSGKGNKAALGRMRKDQIYNIVGLHSELASYALLSSAFNALWDYDDDTKPWEKSQLHRAVNAGLAQLIPLYDIKTIQYTIDAPSPILKLASDILKLVTNREISGLSRAKSKRLIPGVSGIDFIFNEETGLLEDIENLQKKLR